MKQFIGPKEVKKSREVDEKTDTGAAIVEVTYVDKTVEHLPKAMFDAVVTDKATSLEDLRHRRCTPAVSMLLAVLREWGIKLGELNYISALLNQSLDFNRDAALSLLWSKWMPKPLSPDDVDLLTVDRVLKNAGSSATKE